MQLRGILERPESRSCGRVLVARSRTFERSTYESVFARISVSVARISRLLLIWQNPCSKAIDPGPSALRSADSSSEFGMCPVAEGDGFFHGFEPPVAEDDPIIECKHSKR